MKLKSSNLAYTTGLGVIFTCSALLIGCAGNTVKPEPEQKQPLEVVSQKPVATETKVIAQDSPIITPIVAESKDVLYPQTELSEPIQPEITRFSFGFDKYELGDEDKETIRQHARYLANHPEIMVRVIGHTDHHGPKAYNEYLSKKRAEAVTAILLEEGVLESQIEMKALANDKPLETASSTRDNRRVELEFEAVNLVSN